MRPLKGIVVKVGTTLIVRLQSRATLSIARHPDLRLGDVCYILYDYTCMEVRDVWTEAEYHAQEDVSGGEFVLPLPPEHEEPHELAVNSDACF